ncbi:MAG: DUF2058 family protein [Halofilum sp. (in: g-proteobacteria)]|nr:DUF2058 family protein [Halofilum sp. (in: g-proteobacteria)]
MATSVILVRPVIAATGMAHEQFPAGPARPGRPGRSRAGAQAPPGRPTQGRARQARAQGEGQGSKGKGKGKGKGRSATAGASPRRGDADAGQPRPAEGRRATTAQLRQVVKAQRLPRADGDVPYRFTSGRRVKEITVTGAQQRQLARGEAGIVNVEGRYDVVPAAALEAIRALDPKAVVVLNTPASAEADADDPYADHPVPDDLTW